LGIDRCDLFASTVERILYGARTVEKCLAREVERFNARRVLLLTARTLEPQEVFQQVRAVLAARLAETFSAAFEHVPLESALQAAAVARGCRADLVVAFGGGSVIDAAKALRTCVALKIAGPEALGSFMQRPQPLRAKLNLIPQVSIPTTLSGAEYTRSFSATDFASGIKRSYTHSAVAGRVIIYDPVVTLPTPLPLWLASGVMALDHAVEVFYSSSPHLVGDRLKLASVLELFTYLPRVRRRSDDLEARLRCQIGAWLADHSPLRAQDLSPTPATLPSHALAYELGALCRVPYALTACLTLPASMRWAAANSPAALARQAQLVRALEVAEADTRDEVAARLLAGRVRSFIEDLGLPTRLRDAGISKDDVARVARQFVSQGGSLAGSASATGAEVWSLLESAW